MNEVKCKCATFEFSADKDLQYQLGTGHHRRCPKFGIHLLDLDEQYETVRAPKYLIPKAGKLVEAYETEDEIIICGEPESEPDAPIESEEYRKWEEEGHNCEVMGCSTVTHVVHRFNKKDSYANYAENSKEQP